MKKVLIVLILLVLLGVGYTQRHALKSMMGGTSMQPTMHPVMSPAPSQAMMPSNNIYQTKTDATKGAYLTDFQGMTLYMFDKDTPGVSTCYSNCAKVWTAYSSGATAQSEFPANITVITRTDGSKQFAWKGMPLYYYSGDAKAGDLLGDGIGGIWHIVKP